MNNNYHIINSCASCQHHKEIPTIDWKYWVCNLDKTFVKNLNPRPFLEWTDDEILNSQKWMESHEILPNYICDAFE